MIPIKSNFYLSKMFTAGEMLADMFDLVSEQIVPGATSLQIDSWIENYLNSRGMVGVCKGYQGYRHVSCISINDEVVHGVPSSGSVIKLGDLVKVDVCASYSGLCADMARCFFVGDVDEKYIKFVSVAQESLNKGIEMAVPGNRLGDISFAIQNHIDQYGYGILRDFAGHGIGKKMHEEPEVLNYGKPKTGPVLKAGMAFAIEPMITMGSYKVYIAKDGWTVKTVDGSWAAHVEDTVVITENGPKIITRRG